jgi:hypothetical protein
VKRIVSSLVAMALVAACSSTPPASPAPSATAGSGPSAGPTTSVAPTIDPAATASPLPSASASSEPTLAPTVAPSPTPDTGGWAAVLPPLTRPATYIDIGFVGNGELIAVGTDDFTQTPATVWIARYTVGGERKSKINVARKMQTFLGAEAIDVDPTDDTVLFQQLDISTGRYHGYQVRSSTGKVIDTFTLHRAVNAMTVDPKGRLFGISATYGTSNAYHPCIVDRLSASGDISSGVDYNLKACETLGHFAPPYYFEDPWAIDVDTKGNLVFIDWAEDDERRGGEAPGLGLTVLTPAFDFVRHWHLPKSWQGNDLYRGVTSQGTFITGDRDGHVCLVQSVANKDLTKVLGRRMAIFDSSGKIVRSYGYGGDGVGLIEPIAARYDGDGRLWVIDFDPASKISTVRRLD